MTKKKSNLENKIVVFDLDETLGYFSQLYVIWHSLIKLSITKLSVHDFYKLSDIYILYYQPAIFETLKYLKEQNMKTIIFTNNQALFWWPKLIALYLNYKINTTTNNTNDNTTNNTNDNIFKTVIGSYKIRNKINDKRRTSMMKKYTDLKNIMKLDNDTKILFLDDQEHPEMRHSNVNYFKVPDYVVMLPAKNIINIFLHSRFGMNFIKNKNINISFFINYIFIVLKKHNLFPQSIININNSTIHSYKILTKIKNFVERDFESEC